MPNDNTNLALIGVSDIAECKRYNESQIRVDTWDQLVVNVQNIEAWKSRSPKDKQNRHTEKDERVTKYTSGLIPFLASYGEDGIHDLYCLK